MTEYNKVCVTGGCGFIGSHLVRALVARETEVVVLDNLSVGRREAIPADVRLIEGDLMDSRAVEEALAGCDAVFHLAARVAIRSSFEFAVDDATTNLSGTASVLCGIEATGGVKKVVFTSSMAVYADSAEPEPIDENHPMEPASPYGISKLAAERLVHIMAAKADCDSVVLRLFNTYGVGQAYSPYVGVVTIFSNQLSAGEEATIIGDGNQRRDFVHVDDVVAGLLASLDSDVSGETMNIGTGEAISINQVYEDVSAALGCDRPPSYCAAVAGELRNSVADIGKAKSLIGYRPQHRFHSSIARVLNESG